MITSKNSKRFECFLPHVISYDMKIKLANLYALTNHEESNMFIGYVNSVQSSLEINIYDSRITIYNDSNNDKAVYILYREILSHFV